MIRAEYTSIAYDGGEAWVTGTDHLAGVRRVHWTGVEPTAQVSKDLHAARDEYEARWRAHVAKVEAARRKAFADCMHIGIRSRDVPFSTSVARHGDDENRSAHGSVCVIETCVACGGERHMLLNQGHAEHGSWFLPEAAR